jgi:quercetin dioxygenase-like cupin family protein
MINRYSDKNYHTALKGLRMKTLVIGEETLMAEMHLTANSDLPRHNHPYEQTGYLISGKLIMQIGEKEYELHKADSWCIPKDIPHKALPIEDTVVIEIFSPVREDYKKYLDSDAID